MRPHEYHDEDWADRDAPLESDLIDDDENETVNCPECGEEVYEDSEQCPWCGQYITPKVSESRFEKIFWTVIPLGMILLILLLNVLL